MKFFHIVVDAVMKNGWLKTVHHYVRTNDSIEAKEIATEDIKLLIKENWLIERVEVKEVRERVEVKEVRE